MAALKTGIKNCKYQWIFQIDGDAEYSVNDLPRLMKSSQNSDSYHIQISKKYKTMHIISDLQYGLTFIV